MFFEHYYYFLSAGILLNSWGKADPKTIFFCTVRAKLKQKHKQWECSCEINGTLKPHNQILMYVPNREPILSFSLGTKGFWDLTHRLIVHIIIIWIESLSKYYIWWRTYGLRIIKVCSVSMQMCSTMNTTIFVCFLPLNYFIFFLTMIKTVTECSSDQSLLFNSLYSRS